MVSKMVGIRIRRGQRVRLETPGGGGYGPARERDSAKVAEDVRLGYVGRAAAEAGYGVALTADGAVDKGRTAELRTRMA